MKYLDEYRDAAIVRKLIEKIRNHVSRPWVIMEICGGQTHAIARYGLHEILPKEVELVHGPGCPVCVTPLETIDRAHAIASLKKVIFCSFGDMLRVPGTHGDLLSLKGSGSDVRVVYSPLDALALAEKNPSVDVVFFAIGFETTAPANAMAIREAKRRGLKNFSVIVSHVLVPPAISTILSFSENRVQAFLGPGHVCTIAGSKPYETLARQYRVPIVIAGFEPVDIVEGIWITIQQLERGIARVENQYSRVNCLEGNALSRHVLSEVFEICDRKWRGIGTIAKSGLKLSGRYAEFDAENKFRVATITTEEPSKCISGLILRGVKKPTDCPAFGTECTPSKPLGATMVSSEGACSAYFTYNPFSRRAAHE